MSATVRRARGSSAAHALMLLGVISFALPSGTRASEAPMLSVRVCGSAEVVTIPIGPAYPDKGGQPGPDHGAKPCHVCDLRRRSLAG